MLRCLIKYLFFFLFFVGFSACQVTKEIPSKQTKTDVINELFSEIKQSVVPIYYNFDTKRIIHINFEKIDSNHDAEPLLGEYIYTKLEQKLEAANQIDLEPYP